MNTLPLALPTPKGDDLPMTSRIGRAILFDRIPLDIKAIHEMSPFQSRINGGHVFYMDAVKAILKHSSFDEFWFLDDIGPYAHGRAALNPCQFTDKRIRVLKPRDIPTTLKETCTVMMTPTEDPGRLLPLRRMSKRSIPITGHLHAANEDWLIRPLMSMLLGQFSGHDAMICPSEASREALAQLVLSVCAIGGGHVEEAPDFASPVIPIGIDVASFKRGDPVDSKLTLGLDANAVVILYFGRFYTYGKADLGPLLLAFNAIRRTSDVPLVLVLAGTDPEESMCASIGAFAAEIGCGEHVLVLPNPRDDIKKHLLTCADIFVSLSDTVKESFGISLIEAMASQLPVICSDWNGYREVVKNGETGFLIPTSWYDHGEVPGVLNAFGIDPDSTLASVTAVDVEMLTRCLSYLIRYPDRRTAMGEAGRRRAFALYDWRNVVFQYEELWAELDHRSIEPPPPPNRSTQLQQVFSHYPTSLISGTSMLHIVPRGEEWLSRPFPLGLDPEKRFAVLDNEIFRELLLLMSACEVVRYSHLLTAVSTTLDTPEWLVAVHVCRMLKYGLCSANVPSPDSRMDALTIEAIDNAVM